MPPSPPNSVTGLARTFDGIVHRPRSSHRPSSASLSAAAASPCPLDTSAPRPSASLLARPPAAGRPPAPRPTPFNWDLGALPTTTSRHYIPYVSIYATRQLATPEEVLFSCSPQIAVLRSQRRRPTAVRLVCSDSVRPFPKQRRCLSSLVILLGLLPFGRAVKRTEEMSTFDSDCQAAERFLHI